MSWVRRMFGRREIVCREFVELVTAYLDGAMDTRTRARVDRHLGACPACTRYLEQFRTVIELTGQLRETDVATVDPVTREELMAAFAATRGD